MGKNIINDILTKKTMKIIENGKVIEVTEIKREISSAQVQDVIDARNTAIAEAQANIEAHNSAIEVLNIEFKEIVALENQINGNNVG
jgi:hypothetical protein